MAFKVEEYTNEDGRFTNRDSKNGRAFAHVEQTSLWYEKQAAAASQEIEALTPVKSELETKLTQLQAEWDAAKDVETVKAFVAAGKHEELAVAKREAPEVESRIEQAEAARDAALAKAAEKR